MDAAAEECRVIADNLLRLACYDRLPGRPIEQQSKPAESESPTDTATKQLKEFFSDVTVRDELTPKGLGSDPAQFMLGRKNGENYSLVRAAVTYAPAISPFGDTVLGRYGWGPYLSGWFNRNTLTGSRIDARGFSAGLSGTVFDITKEGFALYTNVGLGRKDNRVDGVTSNTGAIDNILVSDVLREGIPYSDPWAWFVYPRFGYYFEDRRETKGGQPTGRTNSLYGGIRIDTYPGLISNRLRVYGYAQWLSDTSASIGIQMRNDAYYKFGLDYLLYNPREKEWLQPSIGLERTIGADPLTGTPNGNSTQLSLRIQVN